MAKEINKRGNEVIRSWVDADRYLFDFNYCSADKGWKQYDTSQDASYFGVWVHLEKRWTLTFAEGDVILVKCPTQESFIAEIDSLRS